MSKKLKKKKRHVDFVVYKLDYSKSFEQARNPNRCILQSVTIETKQNNKTRNNLFINTKTTILDRGVEIHYILVSEPIIYILLNSYYIIHFFYIR